MKPCFGYIRVSTQKQGDGASLEAQKDAITGFASQNNLQITRWFEEKETASKIGRPLFGGMMNALAAGEAEGLILHKVDRTSRNFTDWSRLHEIAKLGVNVFFAADSLDFGTRGGQLLANIQMALAADYSRNLGSGGQERPLRADQERDLSVHGTHWLSRHWWWKSQYHRPRERSFGQTGVRALRNGRVLARQPDS